MVKISTPSCPVNAPAPVWPRHRAFLTCTPPSTTINAI